MLRKKKKAEKKTLCIWSFTHGARDSVFLGKRETTTMMSRERAKEEIRKKGKHNRIEKEIIVASSFYFAYEMPFSIPIQRSTSILVVLDAFATKLLLFSTLFRTKEENVFM